MFGLVKSSIRLRPFRYGRAVSKANARLDRRVSPKPPTQLVGGARVGSEARHSSERTSTRLLKAIVAASRPYHHLVVLLYCAFLLICLWLSASRAGFDANRLWRWPSLFCGLSGRRRYRICKNLRIRRMRRAERAAAWRAIKSAAKSRLATGGAA